MSIHYDDFVTGIRSLIEAWDRCSLVPTIKGESEWKDTRVAEDFGTAFLRIRRYVAFDVDMKPENDSSVPEMDDDDGDGEYDFSAIDDLDSETLIRHPSGLNNLPKQAEIVYDIIHSPTYQVPVLHLAVTNHPGPKGKLPLSPMTSPEHVYALLTPPTSQQQLRTVGVMGAVSRTHHPITGVPVWFVHPCRTAEAMGTDLRGHVQPAEYLLAWLGVVGGSVGLNVPVRLALALRARSAGPMG